MSLLLLLTFTGPVSGQEASGQIGAEVKNQIGVDEVNLLAPSSWERGDIVQIVRGEKVLGEATVMSVDATKVIVSQKGVFETASGDSVRFARKPRGVRASRKPGKTKGKKTDSYSKSRIHKRDGGRLSASNQCSKCKKWISQGGGVPTNFKGRLGF